MRGTENQPRIAQDLHISNVMMIITVIMGIAMVIIKNNHNMNSTGKSVKFNEALQIQCSRHTEAKYPVQIRVPLAG